MPSTERKYNTLFNRMGVDLKEGIVDPKNKISDKMKGQTRGSYNVNASTKRQDKVDYFTSSFSNTVTFDDEECIVLPLDNGLIPIEHKELFLYVSIGKAPDDWTKCFTNSQLLSEVKLEEVKFARH